MPIANAFDMLNGYELADCAAFNQLLELHKKGGIAQYMTDGKHPACLPRLFAHCDEFRTVIAHRLFTKHIIALVQGLQNRLVVHPVLRTDKYTVCELLAPKSALPAFKAVAFRNAVIRSERGTPICTRLGHADNF